MTAVIARIALRYLAGFLVAKGLLAPDVGGGLATDPDVLNVVSTVAGLAIAAASEGWYFLAKRFGWGT